MTSAFAKASADQERSSYRPDIDGFLMAMNCGHLTPKGSEYVGRHVFKPYLDGVAAR